jgi:GT2 family glycosyltransferase
MPRVLAVVVSYNRKALLSQCLSALIKQSRAPDQIIVIDNASTDGSAQMLADDGWLSRNDVELVSLPTNTGGAGGFSEGLRVALCRRADWVWMMDDDALPHLTALESLLSVAADTSAIYGSVATFGSETSWATTLLDPPIGKTHDPSKIPVCAEVESVPFLGFLIHRDLAERIGLPDAGYFIAADDIEYCLRARSAGAKLYIAGLSRIEHPKAVARHVRMVGREITYLSLPPWKRYYDTRNRILNARRYATLRLITQVIPGTFVRLLVALGIEPRKSAQAKAFLTGTIDGLFGIKGQRHERWGLSKK